MQTKTDWEQGEPCPECGGTEISVQHEIEEIYYSNDGEFEFQKNGPWSGGISHPLCLDCEEKL